MLKDMEALCRWVEPKGMKAEIEEMNFQSGLDQEEQWRLTDVEWD